jgi:hypothetical protein
MKKHSTLRVSSPTGAGTHFGVARGFGPAAGAGSAGHSFAHVAVSPPGGVIQRVFHKADGDPYKSIKRSAWYRQLTPQEQGVADDMHTSPTVHPSAKALNLVRTEATRRATATAPVSTPVVATPSPSSAPVTSTPPSATIATPSPSPSPALTTTTTTPVTSPADEFQDRIGYGSGYVQKEVVESDDDTDVKSASEGSDHYRDLLLKDLAKAKKEEEDADDSSDSEAEVGTDPERRKRRRKYKASQLGAITRTFSPLNDKEQQFFADLSKRRERDNQARPKKRQMYAKDTREQFAEVGEQFKLTNFHHNPYLRRATRKAWSKDKIKAGGSGEYDKNQGKVREKLLKEVQADHAKMQWKREDFPDDQTWESVQWMTKNEVGNKSTGALYHEKAEAGEDTTDTSARVGFHHEAFKEAMGGIFAPYAMTPVNLTALNDRRELLNAKKVKALRDAKKPLPPVGAHDKFGHQGSGFVKEQKGKMVRSKGGGQFSDLDAEAVFHITRPIYKRRTPKARLYDVPKTTASATPTPPATVSSPTTPTAPSTSSATVTPSSSLVTATPSIPLFASLISTPPPPSVSSLTAPPSLFPFSSPTAPVATTPSPSFASTTSPTSLLPFPSFTAPVSKTPSAPFTSTPPPTSVFPFPSFTSLTAKTPSPASPSTTPSTSVTPLPSFSSLFAPTPPPPSSRAPLKRYRHQMTPGMVTTSTSPPPSKRKKIGP